MKALWPSLLVALAVAGCGGSSDPSASSGSSGAGTPSATPTADTATTTSTPTSTPTPKARDDQQEIRKVAAESAAAYNASDADAVCALYSSQGKAGIIQAAGQLGTQTTDCAAAVKAVLPYAGKAKTPSLSSLKVTGNSASAHDDASGEDYTYRLVGGSWKIAS